jgi:hypothetical protein
MSFRWIPAHECGLEGREWDDTELPYDRLPARAKGVVRDPVWALSRAPAGLSVRFQTNAPEIKLRWKLGAPVVGTIMMPALGRCGFDLYADDSSGRPRWANATHKMQSAEEEYVLLAGLDGVTRCFTLYLPLCVQVLSLEIGTPPDADFTPIPPRRQGRIVYYGTSIVHGSCVSRPGMAVPAILSRRLGRAVTNLGFAGNAHMEPEVARYLAELDPAVFILDALPNMNAERVELNAEQFIRTLRTARPGTPLVLVEDRTFTNAWLFPDLRERNRSARAALRTICEKLAAEGITGLTSVEGDRLYGSDGEVSMDGSHPSDLGAMRIADALAPVLRKVLDGKCACG